jgi:AcrR family transcriptional regulator
MKKAIVAASCELFAKKGFDATSILEIAREMGISTGTIMYHFGAKDNLLLAVLEQHNESLVECLLHATKGSMRFDRTIENFIDAFFSHLENNPASWRVFLQTSITQNSKSEDALSSLPMILKFLNFLIKKNAQEDTGLEINPDLSTQISEMLMGAAWMRLALGRPSHELQRGIIDQLQKKDKGNRPGKRKEYAM